MWLASSLMEGLAMILAMAAMKCGNKKAAREDFTTREKRLRDSHNVDPPSDKLPRRTNWGSEKNAEAQSSRVHGLVACMPCCSLLSSMPRSPAVGVLAVLLGGPLKERFLSTPWGCQEAEIYYRHGQKKTTTFKNLNETVISKELLLKPHVLIAQI